MLSQYLPTFIPLKETINNCVNDLHYESNTFHEQKINEKIMKVPRVKNEFLNSKSEIVRTAHNEHINICVILK